jgi:hypothetical protein
LPDPTRVSFAQCLSIGEDGIISALNAHGADLIDLLHLNESPVIDTRKKYLRVIKLRIDYPDSADIAELFLDAFGFPDDLPDLTSLRPPGGNHPKLGAVVSYHRLRRLNELREVY